MDKKERFNIFMRKHSESTLAKTPVKASTEEEVQQDNRSKMKFKKNWRRPEEIYERYDWENLLKIKLKQ